VDAYRLYSASIRDGESPAELSFYVVPAQALAYPDQFASPAEMEPRQLSDAFGLDVAVPWPQFQVSGALAMTFIHRRYFEAYLADPSFRRYEPDDLLWELPPSAWRYTAPGASAEEILALVKYARRAEVIPIEGSPLEGESLAGLASVAGGGVAVGIAAAATSPIVLVFSPVAIILCGAAWSVSRALDGPIQDYIERRLKGGWRRRRRRKPPP
jgi:hypothetical protein